MALPSASPSGPSARCAKRGGQRRAGLPAQGVPGGISRGIPGGGPGNWRGDAAAGRAGRHRILRRLAVCRRPRIRRRALIVRRHGGGAGAAWQRILGGGSWAASPGAVLPGGEESGRRGVIMAMGRLSRVGHGNITLPCLGGSVIGPETAENQRKSAHPGRRSPPEPHTKARIIRRRG